MKFSNSSAPTNTQNIALLFNKISARNYKIYQEFPIVTNLIGLITTLLTIWCFIKLCCIKVSLNNGKGALQKYYSLPMLI